MDLMALTLDHLNKEIKVSQDKVSNVETQLKDSLSKDEFDTIKNRTKENVDNFKKETEKRKRQKLTRDTQDYLEKRVYKWQYSSFRPNYRNYRSTDGSSVSSSDNERGEYKKALTSHIIDRKTKEFLTKEYPIIPVFYVLPKIHKNMTKPPGRPIVASTDSILSPLSILLEKVLTPLVKDTQAFLLDTGAFLKIIKDIGTLPEGTLLVTLDVNNLYTSIQHVKGIRATECILRDSHKDPNIISFLLSLLELVLTENFFLFEDTFYVQVQGSAMGSNVAPPYANCFMSVFESDHIYNNELFQTHCLLWRRYIDDVFCLWRGSQDTLLAFLEHINSVWPELSFTLNYSTTQINFLDKMVIQQPDGSIMVDLYVKETDRNNLLLYQSCHPTAVKKSIPCSQFERVRRIVSDPIVRSQGLNEMEGKFSLRGYPPRMLKQCRNTISSKKDSGSPPRIPLVNTFHPFLYKFHNKIRKHWHILRDSFPEVPEFQIPFMPCFRRPNNLRNKVVRADIGSRLTMPKQLFLRTQKKGTFQCLQCAQCANVLKGPKISHPQTGADIPIRGFFTCNSKQVIYAIKCPCGKVYVGETMQTIKERISHHKSDIRCGKNHLPIPYHFQEAGHSVTQLRFLVLEQRSDLEFNKRICGFPLSQPGYLLNGTYSEQQGMCHVDEGDLREGLQHHKTSRELEQQYCNLRNALLGSNHLLLAFQDVLSTGFFMMN
ncbi:unnamed protein product [Ranitomeya imitator]|uniref:Reverse transcriptase domain-containing protein n=1 Tax=Ranitomeya imitator TaxID=111125 RepID=A0ABN9KWX8_9NEOB|nr:unnamed protein product [Ranitomeya imitator]